METAQLTLQFDDAASQLAFKARLEATALNEKPFRMVLPTETQNMDNETLQLLLTFMQHGGLGALAAFIGLVRDILKKLWPDKSVKITSSGKTEVITSRLSNGEVKQIAKKLSSD
jgi:hypothetical protein